MLRSALTADCVNIRQLKKNEKQELMSIPAIQSGKLKTMAFTPVKQSFTELKFFLAAMSMQVVMVFLLLVAPLDSHSALTSKTPDDVFRRAEDLKQKVLELRLKQGITRPWPDIQRQTEKEPRHVYQKSLEVLGKIARLRDIKKMGPITVPHYPSTEITENEVFGLVDRLVSEMEIIQPEKMVLEMELKEQVIKSQNDVYEILWEISKALDGSIRIPGLKPTDVYALSFQVLEMTRFLRITQNISLDVEMPVRTQGKHPNHALAATIALAEKISLAEKNLWMKPISVPDLPNRTVLSEEVYDTLLLVVAELHRIQHRIGVERYFAIQEVEGSESPDDVLFNINTSINLMPDFAKTMPLVQRERQGLRKTPNDVCYVAEHILKNLMEYRQLLGIRTIPREIPLQTNLKPRHVYAKVLECLNKTDLLRKRLGLGGMVLPSHPLRDITPSEVYQQAVRLDAELDLVLESSGLHPVPVQLAVPEEIHRNKTPSDAHRKMWEIAYLLDTILGLEGYRPTDVYHQAIRIVQEIFIIRSHLGETRKVEMPPLREGIAPADVIEKASETDFFLNKVKRRAGISEWAVPIYSQEGEVTPNDVFNHIGIILEELIMLKVHFQIAEEAPSGKDIIEEKTPSHVYQQIEYAGRLLNKMLSD